MQNAYTLKNTVCETDGKGFWSCVKKAVNLTEIKLDYFDESEVEEGIPVSYATFKLYFDKFTWNIRNDGLIYTDDKFIREFRKRLVEMGFTKKAAAEIDYTEQGQQGNNYVHICCYSKARSGSSFFQQFVAG